MPYWQPLPKELRLNVGQKRGKALAHLSISWKSLLKQGELYMLPNAIFERVKAFLIRIIRDEDFRTQLQTGVVEQTQKVLQDNGYTFSKDEFESATLKILELKEQDQFHELTEAELVAAVGGWLGREPIIQPLYGVIIDPPKEDYPRPDSKPRPWPRPKPRPRPPGITPIRPPIAQPLYGVVISSLD